jgi:uncharacterized protein with ParB-like and HNH nuclease domain
MNPKAKTFHQFFGQDTYVIPDYQRPYEWQDSSHINDFWQDILQQTKDIVKNPDDYSSLFLGVVILEQVKNKTNFEVVDGQQRITTIFILLVAIREVLKELKDIKVQHKEGLNESFETMNFDPLISTIGRYLSKEDSKGNTEAILLKAHKLIEQLMNWICDVSWDGTFNNKKYKSQKNVRNVYKYFSDNLRELVKIKKDKDEYIDIEKISPNNISNFIDAMKSIEFITLEVSSRQEAYELFERVNARGKELDVGDLLKNHLFTKNATMTDELGKKRDLEEKVLRFLKYFHTTQGGYSTNKKLYRKLKEISKGGSSELLSNLYEYSEYTKYIRDCKTTNDTYEYFVRLMGLEENPKGKGPYTKSQLREITESIVGLDLMNVTQYYPVFYSVISRFDELNLINIPNYQDYIPRFIQLIENYHFVNNLICDTVGNDIEKLYADSAHKINKAKTKDKFTFEVNELVKSLRAQLKKENVFIESYVELDYEKTPNKVLHYIYDRMNSFDLAGKKRKRLSDSLWKQLYERGKTYRRTEVTSEHWRNRNERKENDLTDNIGNLIYLDAKVNSEKVNNLTTSQKREYLEKNPAFQNIYLKYLIDTYGSRLDKWTDNDIKDHASAQAKLAYTKIWKFNPELIIHGKK